MTAANTQMVRKLLRYAGRSFKAIWEFNENYWMSPLTPVVCLPVMIQVTGALFPPIEQSCFLSEHSNSHTQIHEERLLP